MATRTIKMMGNAYSEEGTVSLTVSFNGTQVHNGTVTTTASALPAEHGSDAQEMFTFELDTDTTGDFPLSIAVSGGTFVFGYLHGNYGHQGTFGESDPATVWDHMHMNTETTDGKKNPAINGSALSIRGTVDGPNPGPWFYVIGDGETFSCDYDVGADPAVTVPNALCARGFSLI